MTCIIVYVFPVSAQPNPRRTVNGGTLTYRNLTKTDAQVVQCYATNRHGSIFLNAFLNVQGVHTFKLKLYYH